MKVWQANLALMLTAMIWGMGFVATDNALKFLQPLQMQIFRFGIATIILAIIFIKRLLKVNKRAIIYGLLIGLIFFLSMTLQTFGLTDTTVPKNAFITVTNVIWVPIIGLIFLRNKPKPYLIIGILIMLVGFFFLIFEIDIFNLSYSLSNLSTQMKLTFGDFLTLLCAIGFAVHILMAAKFVASEDPIVILIFQLGTSTILSIILTCIMEGNPLEMGANNILNALPWLLFMAIFSSILAFALQLIAQQYLPASNAAIICSLESLFASVFAVILGNTIFTSSLAISIVVITLGIIWAETGFKFLKKEIQNE